MRQAKYQPNWPSGSGEKLDCFLVFFYQIWARRPSSISDHDLFLANFCIFV